MWDLKYLLYELKANSVLVSYLSFFISLGSLLLARYAMLQFARNEFIKKQIHEVIELTSHLNGKLVDVSFRLYDGEGGSSGVNYTTNIFEIKNLESVARESHFADSPIAFNRVSNQILDIKGYITNPFIPKSIADELDKLYSRNNYDLHLEQIQGKLIVIDSGIFEETIFQKLDNPQVMLRNPSAFAFESFDNLIECSQLLNKAIVFWLRSYKVKEINIRSYRWERDE